MTKRLGVIALAVTFLSTSAFAEKGFLADYMGFLKAQVTVVSTLATKKAEEIPAVALTDFDQALTHAKAANWLLGQLSLEKGKLTETKNETGEVTSRNFEKAILTPEKFEATKLEDLGALMVSYDQAVTAAQQVLLSIIQELGVQRKIKEEGGTNDFALLKKLATRDLGTAMANAHKQFKMPAPQP